MTKADISDRAMAQRAHAALSIAVEAGHLAMTFFGNREALGTKMKGFQDWLTEADGAVEKLIRKRVSEAFPDDAFVGEEDGVSGDSEVRWIVDPIDGTANFAHGSPIWCVSVGVVVGRMPEIGAIVAPAQDQVYFARRGQGATLNGKPIRVAETSDPRLSAVEFGWSNRRPAEAYVGMVTRALAAGISPMRGGSGALGLARVGAGHTDGYAELHINAWDVAAALVIVKEAGAHVSDFFAGEALTKGNSILCCTPGIARVLQDVAGLA